jgi:polynucleotide 5'-kinase involved in rRNA processing
MTTRTKRAKIDRVRPRAIVAFHKNTKPSKTVTAFS